jgi:hypothetical protein
LFSPWGDLGRFKRLSPRWVVFEDGAGLVDIPSVAVAAFGFDFGEGKFDDAVAAGEDGFGGFEVVETGPEDWC